MTFAEVAPIIGVLAGGVVGAGGALLRGWFDQRGDRSREARQREQDAAAQARSALTKLLLMEPDPDFDRRREEYRLQRSQRYEDAMEVGEPDQAAMASWSDTRGELIMIVDSAAGDFRSRELRERLTEACDMLWLSDGPEKYAHQMEPRTRNIAVRHARDCVAAFRRGDGLPGRPKEFTDTLDLVRVYMDELEANSRS